MLYYICKVEKLYNDNKQKENIVENKNKNVETIVLLDDGETWCSAGYALLITEETKKLFLEEREVEVDPSDDVDELFWDEMGQDKAIRDLDETAEYISVADLVEFYIQNKK